ncbi:arsenate reductase (glutaredoxin) [Psychroflexus montanilacus]|uniref:arsenate reductase (glutaredoxin) n=1 Tax=Psychroflexus montanilacus TaxID=2873598 RepID=UPI001CCEC3EC|nr:arsenate reductase (glutaredoxin) [Psychroflexus montanilacus]MBZ9651197.1 arsenate reductase (glutaredoxin) [Psychroflexus montanilacus]
MIKIYHNPRCKKSREGLAILEESGKDFKIIKYLDEVPSKDEIKSILDQLGISPIDLVRTQEKIWKESYKGKTLTNSELIEALHEHPKLIERPIVINNNKAVIGRPPENIKEIL